jgi:hypothetical protein
MAFGGTAQTYILWKKDGEPFKEGKVQYIYVLHPITKAKKKVRWYSDKAHAALNPDNKNKYGPFHTVFGFKSADDRIFAIREKDLSQEEITKYFSYKWRFGMFFGGIWYAPADTTLPPIAKKDKYFTPNWKEFVEAGRIYSKELNLVPEAESPWFKENVAC